MKATEATFLALLRKSPQFVIPIYQRTYSWTEKECRQLWDDIVRCGANDRITVHFVGSIVYVESGLSQVTHQTPLLVIDGQQRLTTVSLLLAALAESVGDEEPFHGFSRRKIKNYYLLNPEETGDRHYKLLLSQTDKASLKAIVGGGEQPHLPSLRITKFRRDIQTRDLYNFRTRSYWLRRMENHGRKERVVVDEYTIEHILPQNENLSPKWREALGSDWQRVQQTWLHTLGNLTLTAYNSDYSDRPFADKRDMPDAPEKGLKQSPLKLNQGLGILDTWNEDTIKARAEKLAHLALSVWSAPVLPEDILDAYRGKGTPGTEYTINDHPNLLTPNIQSLFEAFRKSVTALDPCVTEEFLKLYVAYKAETNFVDVIPQAKRLRLSLNMRFNEVSDPKGLCKDVTGLGRWGNGDVEIGLSRMEDLPYVIGLVRQSLELQLGGGGDV